MAARKADLPRYDLESLPYVLARSAVIYHAVVTLGYAWVKLLHSHCQIGEDDVRWHFLLRAGPIDGHRICSTHRTKNGDLLTKWKRRYRGEKNMPPLEFGVVADVRLGEAIHIMDDGVSKTDYNANAKGRAVAAC